jgi:hypothetical protein
MTPCTRCGQQHTACDKHRKDGQPCGTSPVQGTTTCRMHAGKRLEVVKQEVATRRALAELELDGEANPLDELLNEVQRAAAAVRWLADKVNSLEDREITHGITRTVQHADGSRDVTASAAVNLWVKMWQEERDRLARVCKLTLDAGVDERRVRLAEAQGRMIVDVIRATLLDLHVEDTDEVHEVVSRHLRAIGA